MTRQQTQLINRNRCPESDGATPGSGPPHSYTFTYIDHTETDFHSWTKQFVVLPYRLFVIDPYLNASVDIMHTHLTNAPFDLYDAWPAAGPWLAQ